MRLSLIVPCFNEQDNIFPFARAVAEVFPDPSDYEIVFVNDGSKDKTLQNLKELHRQSQQNIRVVSFSRNFGKESAIYAGLQHCDGEYISLIDADLQQDPAIVKQMTEILDAEPDTDCVCAFQETRHENKLMTSVKSAFYKMATNMSEVDFVDGASDFRTFRRTVRDALLQMPEYFRFSKGLFSWVGFNTKYIPYEAKERASGTTKWGFKKLLKYGWNGILAFSTAPLKLATGGIRRLSSPSGHSGCCPPAGVSLPHRSSLQSVFPGFQHSATRQFYLQEPVRKQTGSGKQ